MRTLAETNEKGREVPSFDRLATELRLDELEQCLSSNLAQEVSFQAAESRFTSHKAGIERLPEEDARRYALFKLLVQEKEGRLRWQALKEQTRNKHWDTDAEVLKLWKELDREPPSEEFPSSHWSVIYHRLWLFDWLLRRYDIRRAREVAGGGKWAWHAHLLLLAAVVVVFVLRRKEWLGADKTWGALLFCGLAYGAVLAGLALSFKLRKKLPDGLEAFAVATHSLIPRLAGAGAVGLVILASSQELLRVVIDTKWWWLIGLVFAGYIYLLLEMARRIHPMPRPGRLVLHGFDVATTALAHSMTLALLAEGGLRRVLADPSGSGFSLWQSLSVVVFVFTIGLVVNLIWAEQPVTEPL